MKSSRNGSDHYKIYEEDVVQKNGQLGIVEYVAGSHHDDTEDNSDSEIDEHLEDGHARVCWLSGGEPCVEKLDDLTVVDRSFLHGDVVALADDPLSQSGTVIDVNLHVDVQWCESRDKRYNINSRYLQHVHPLTARGSYAVCKNWLCTIDDCLFDIVIQFADGAKCLVELVEPDTAATLSAEVNLDDNCPFYPSMTISTSKKFLKDAKWISGKYDPKKHKEGQIVHVTVSQAFVSWVTSNAEDGLEPPADLDVNTFVPLRYFSYTNWQIGDKAIIPTAIQQLPSAQLAKEPNPEHLKIIRNYDNREDYKEFYGKGKANNPSTVTKKTNLAKQCVQIIGTHTTVDVMWQDGTIARGIPSTTLIPLHHIQDHDFWPQDFVRLRQDQDEQHQDKDNNRDKSVAVIQHVNASERTCTVKWISDNSSGSTEELSVYELETHPDYDYRLGDVVVRLSHEADATTDTNGSAHHWVGEIVRMKDGNLDVCWPDDTITTVKYSEVYVIQEDSETQENDEYYEEEQQEQGEEDAEQSEDEESTFAVTLRPQNQQRRQHRTNRHAVASNSDDEWEDYDEDEDNDTGSADEEEHEESDEEYEEGEDMGDDDNASDGSWETVESGSEVEAEEEEDNPWNEEPELTHPHDQIERDEVLIGYRDQDDDANAPADIASASASSHTTTTTTNSNNRNIKNRQFFDEGDESVMNMDEQLQEALKALEMSNTIHTPNSQPRFAMVEEVLDHYFGPDAFDIKSRKFVATVAKEWKILNDNLPDGIYVRAYENRMDLMRAIITGPSGTPYNAGLFIFDIQLPPEYPLSPPRIHFWSYGYKINPNLYEDGHVCLSLLGTWTGKDNCEEWNPEKSNVLQLLVSIMGLVLVSEPYYNEAGYDQQIGSPEGTKNSRFYNEQVFLINISHMAKTILLSPAHSQQVILQHFAHHGPAFLSRCKKLLSGAPSQGFLTTLRKRLPRLEAALMFVAGAQFVSERNNTPNTENSSQ